MNHDRTPNKKLSQFQRRDCMKLIAGSIPLAIGNHAWGATKSTPTKLGLVMYCVNHRRKQMLESDADFDLFSPLNLLGHCEQIGAGGMQVSVGKLTPQERKTLRDRAGASGMYIEAIVKVPATKGKRDAFTREMQAAAEVGAKAARTTVIPGRRYEYFQSVEDFRTAEKTARRSLEIAAPIAEKMRIPLAVENHKDQRIGERIRLLEQIDSEFVGTCVDTGNSFALLDDPIEAVKAFAPWAHSVHLKDQALQSYDDGFLLADIPLGQGAFDLKAMVEMLRTAKPQVSFNLELITRDPLQVPVLNESYWRTFPKLPASDLARSMRYVRDHSGDNLQQISRMSPAERVDREDRNVRESFAYAQRELGL